MSNNIQNNLSRIIKKSIDGDLPQDKFTEAVEKVWESGHFVLKIAPENLPDIHTAFANDDTERLHGQGKGFRTQILASPPEGEHGSGWTLVTAPEPEECEDTSYDDYKVKPHIHHTASILLVVNGIGLLSIQKGENLIQKKVSKGTVVLFPAEVPHTFKVLSKNFQVASGKSEYRSYGNSEFELPLPFSSDLTRVSYDEYEQTLGLY